MSTVAMTGSVRRRPRPPAPKFGRPASARGVLVVWIALIAATSLALALL
ncbi:hypothetical protein [Nocardia farcinica]|nr:hypothetical protein [Nocardia farcinica]